MSRKRPKGEVRDIGWHAISPKEQAHQLCRYCLSQHPGGESYGAKRATHMRKQGRQGWVPLCWKHAGYPGSIIPNPFRSV